MEPQMSEEARVTFHLPTKPLTVIDLINRRAAATGSIRYAMLTSDADYNGHSNRLCWNDYRSYYVGEYQWDERCVFVRSTDAVHAVRTSIQEYSRQGRGASLSLSILPKDADAVRAAFPELIEGSAEQAQSSWWTWRHAKVGEAMTLHREHLLLRARDPEHYERLCGRVKTKDGGYTTDFDLAAREWQAVANVPVSPEVNTVPA